MLHFTRQHPRQGLLLSRDPVYLKKNEGDGTSRPSPDCATAFTTKEEELLKTIRPEGRISTHDGLFSNRCAIWRRAGIIPWKYSGLDEC